MSTASFLRSSNFISSSCALSRWYLASCCSSSASSSISVK
ncbi:hypothetical protein 2016_scaffold57_00072 [Bacteriophage sp.]|nr:hypothetical protein 2016_scaffold57_00072 [Bacteriophage sp.]